jgi:hypothetical protein
VWALAAKAFHFVLTEPLTVEIEVAAAAPAKGPAGRLTCSVSPPLRGGGCRVWTRRSVPEARALAARVLLVDSASSGIARRLVM